MYHNLKWIGCSWLCKWDFRRKYMCMERPELMYFIHWYSRRDIHRTNSNPREFVCIGNLWIPIFIFHFLWNDAFLVEWKSYNRTPTAIRANYCFNQSGREIENKIPTFLSSYILIAENVETEIHATWSCLPEEIETHIMRIVSVNSVHISIVYSDVFCNL